MAIPREIFDPDGDVLLLLVKPEDLQPKKGYRSQSRKSHKKKKSVSFESEEMRELNEMRRNRLKALGGTQGLPSEHSRSVSSSSTQSQQSNLEIEMLVSSKHLMLASPVFKIMLGNDNFKEGREFGVNGNLTVPLPDDNPDAMHIIMSVIHGRHRHVPKEVGLRELTEIAILADKYQIVELLEVFSDGWIENLEESLPRRYLSSVDLDGELAVPRWIAVSWVFGKADLFKRMTSVVERNCGSNPEKEWEEELPIPGRIFESIRAKREDALSHIYNYLDITIEKYQTAGTRCQSGYYAMYDRVSGVDLKTACDAMVVGSFLKSLAQERIYPAPNPPYDQMSFHKLATGLSNLKVMALCDTIGPAFIRADYSNSAYESRGHNLKVLIISMLKNMEEQLSGLDLEEFKSPLRT